MRSDHGAARFVAPKDSANPKELSAFLRAHREQRQPEDVGLPNTGRRRTPGLRREEVAALAGVGVAWYTWLEQGRVVASKKVLESVAQILGLDVPARRHLLALAGYLPPALEQTDHQAVARRTQCLLDSWETSPAVLLDSRFDITAWNRAYAAVWSDPGHIAPARRNFMWCVAGDPAIRANVIEWNDLARAVLAQFRTQTARHDDARTQEIYAVLRADFPELTTWWECQAIDDLTAREVVVAVGPHDRLRLMFSAFRPVDDPDALVLVQAPATLADRSTVASLVLDFTQRQGEEIESSIINLATVGAGNSAGLLRLPSTDARRRRPVGTGAVPSTGGIRVLGSETDLGAARS
ncbi:helix-turn-helix transcriptional regulator [Nocardia sp. NPDC050175]|uniref:helix-turn-helix transcriptional regulator n=1 Tax=Nocardia sp. NPDC050175 TaxID=3364317 RepID=UPI00379F785B